MIRFLHFITAIVCCAVVFLGPTIAMAHPLGNFTVNHYSRLEPSGDGVRIRYVLDMAEIPTLQETPRIDRDGDGRIDAAERDAYAAVRAEAIRRNLQLTLNGTVAPIRRLSQVMSLLEGQGGLSTLRLEAEYFADLITNGSEQIQATYRDDDEPSRIGWREIVVRSGAARTEVRSTSVPDHDVSNELSSYPDGLLNSPLNVRDARFVFGPGPATIGSDPVTRLSEGRRTFERARSAVTGLVALDEVTPWTVLLSLVLATLFGAQHALTPGHGKTVVAAYLVGARGTARHALFLGATVTATHTLGVFALGFVTLFLSQYILPERLYPILEVVSGLLVVGIGGWLFMGRLRGALANWHSSPTRGMDKHEDSHSHGHHHPHEHEHGQGHGHSHDHEHQHTHHGTTHSHGGVEHNHMPPGADGSRVTWRSLLILGVSGGLLPCPTALVLLLGAISLNRVAFGLVLTLFFSLGLAGVLVGIGLLLVYARPLLQRLSLPAGRFTRLIPVGSAMVITLAGVAITVAALPGVLAL